VILGRDRHPAAACFDELEAALVAMGRGDVVLNAHAFPGEIPVGATVYNLENVGLQVDPASFARGHEIWEFSRANLPAWERAGREVTYVPIGYHPTMDRFALRPWRERFIDVVFVGHANERRAVVLDALRDRGLRVLHIGTGEAYGSVRDVILSHAKLALNVLFYPGGTFPVLRAAHCVANGLPILSEDALETPAWSLLTAPYDELVDVAVALTKYEVTLATAAAAALASFTAAPFVLPRRRAFWKDERSARIEIVPAPGDRCGGARVLADGSTCPGCRGCA
jgi:hypothetical protein